MFFIKEHRLDLFVKINKREKSGMMKTS